MPAKADFQLVGADRLGRTAKAVARQLGDLSGPGEAASGDIARRARSKAPRRSGALASSIESGASASEAFAGAGAPYARPIEFGWPARGIRPQPYLEPAADESAWSDAYAKRLDELLATVEGA
jgi:hypothetical protein